jgi:hypothetical protein
MIAPARLTAPDAQQKPPLLSRLIPSARREAGTYSELGRKVNGKALMQRPSPLQNRVTPTGEIEAVPARGLYTGNRGVLHGDGYTLGAARWKHRNWIICALAFKGRRRALMTPRRWTELFFLDEAVALAAGHRPCAECRRAAYNSWMAAVTEGLGRPRPAAPEADRLLHQERAVPGARRLKTHVAAMAGLPDGAFVLTAEGQPALTLGDSLRPWTHFGYGPPVARPKGQARLLTPPMNVAALRAGYRPTLHPSAAA